MCHENACIHRGGMQVGLPVGVVGGAAGLGVPLRLHLSKLLIEICHFLHRKAQESQQMGQSVGRVTNKNISIV